MEKQAKNLKQKGNQHYKEGEYGLAVAMYRKYVARPHEDNKNAYCNMALCYYKHEKYQECVQACKEALRIDDKFVKVYYRLALAYDRLGNEFQAFVNADQFCLLGKEDKDGQDYKEMHQIKQRNYKKIAYPVPIPVAERDLIFYPEGHVTAMNEGEKEGKSEGLKDRKEDQEYFKGYTWADVREKVDSGAYRDAINMCYSLGKNYKGKKEKQMFKRNLETVKAIRRGTLPPTTKIAIEFPQLDVKQVQTQPQTVPPQTPKTPQTPIDPYTEHFLQPLQQSRDIFESFPSTVLSLLRNRALPPETKQSILLKAAKEYPMFTVLQLSLSATQKRDIRGELALDGELGVELDRLLCS